MPSEFLTFTTSWSPRFTWIVGQGNSPLMPITGRTSRPSGFALTQVSSQSYVTTAEEMSVAKERNKRESKLEEGITRRV